VHVLQDDEEWAGGRQLAEQARDGLEQLQPPVLDRLWGRPVLQGAPEVAVVPRHGGEGSPGEQPGEHRVAGGRGRQVGIGRDRAQQIHEGQIGQADVAKVDAVPDQHAGTTLGRPRRELVEQPGLAHARVTGQQDRGRATRHRVVDVRQEPRQFPGPADHRHVVPARHVQDRGTVLRQVEPDRSDRGQRALRRLRNQPGRRVRVPRPEAVSTSRR
jgi:hypothetical protein